MAWTSLIPLGAAILGGIFGGKQTTTTTPQMTPELEAAAKEIFERAMQTFSKDYPEYDGQRVAAPTAARDQLSQFLPSLSKSVGNSLSSNNNLHTRLNNVLDRSPMRVQVPTLLDGTASSVMSGGGFGPGMSSGLGGGAMFSLDEAADLAKSAMPKRNYDQSWVAFDPAKAV